MPSVDCDSFNSFVSEMSLPPSAPLRLPEVEVLSEQTPWPTVSQPKTSNHQAVEETLVPGKNWEYNADYPLHNLKPHPLQKDLFVGLNDAGIEELAEDIKNRDLQNPIEILPDGTIFNGHQRYQAYKLLGREQIPVYLRHDLNNQPETAVKEHIVQDNLQRKHLHPLEIARCYLHLRQYQKEQEAAGEAPVFTLRELHRDLARRFDISGRTLDRYLAALKAPGIIQNACIEGLIRFNQVCKISELSKDSIQALLQRIEDGEDLVAVVEEYTRPYRQERDPAVKAILALTRQFKRNFAEIEENIADLPYTQKDLQQCQPVLEQAVGLLVNLLEFYRNPPSLSPRLNPCHNSR